MRQFDDENLLAYPEEVLFEYEDGSSDDVFTDNHDDDVLYHNSGSGLSLFTLSQIVDHCVEPTVRDGLRHVGTVVVWCVIFRCLALTKTTSFNHISSSVIGVIVLAHFFHLNTFYLLALSAIAYLVLLFVHRAVGRCRGAFLMFFCFVFCLICELFIAAPPDWHQIRGAQMILSMKLISLGFDMDRDRETPPSEESEPKKQNLGVRKSRMRRSTTQKHPNHRQEEAEEGKQRLASFPRLAEYFGYVLCPGNCIFGPWVKYTDYLDIFVQPRWDVGWFVKIVFTLGFSFMFLTISTCWNPWMIPDGSWKWWIAYRDAMSFRASHYFVSYVGEATAVAAGFGSSLHGDDGAVSWNGVQITQPHNVELPRSLLDVVVSWNIPMHKWLKTYCFKPALQKWGGPVAIFSTYAASSLLHGFNFQLASVLLSLGFYTYTEYMFRKKLADLFNMSFAAKGGGKYKHNEGEIIVFLVNLLFGILACFHLAYLGVMFSQQEDIMVDGYSWWHTLSKWAELGFLSHWIVLATFIVTLLF